MTFGGFYYFVCWIREIIHASKGLLFLFQYFSSIVDVRTSVEQQHHTNALLSVENPYENWSMRHLIFSLVSASRNVFEGFTT